MARNSLAIHARDCLTATAEKAREWMNKPPLLFEDCRKCVAGQMTRQGDWTSLPTKEGYGEQPLLCTVLRKEQKCPHDRAMRLTREWLQVQREQAAAQREQAAAMRELAAAMRETGNTGPVWTVADPAEVMVYDGPPRS